MAFSPGPGRRRSWITRLLLRGPNLEAESLRDPLPILRLAFLDLEAGKAHYGRMEVVNAVGVRIAAQLVFRKS